MDPTTRFGHVRRLLKEGKAVVVQRKPFTIRLTYQITDPVTHTCMGSTDPGRTNIGNAVIRKDDEVVVYTDKTETANKDVPKHMRNRREARQASRRGERKARKRLAKKHNTLSTKLDNGRMIPGCEKATEVKDIINTEARFKNRKRHGNVRDVVNDKSVWVTPTVKQLVQTHLNHVDQIRALYPVTEWCLEVNKFAFMRMEDGTIKGMDYQNGRMKGYKTVEDYVFALQKGKCAHCGKSIRDIHHIIPRHKGGSDGPENRVGLCDECHHLLHIGELDIDAVGEKQKYGALSVLNQAIPLILEGLIERFGEECVYTCFGHHTMDAREILGLGKDHDNDAIAIAAAATGIKPKYNEDTVETFQIRQYRRHDRARIKCQRERTYKLQTGFDSKGKPTYKTVAKNRKPREEQKGKALSQWFNDMVKLHGEKEARVMRSRLKVTASKRYYNLMPKDRIMPGATYEYKGKRFVLQSREGNGTYFIPSDKSGRVQASECRILTRNTGFVYV